MSNGFPTSPRRPIQHKSQGSLPSSSVRVGHRLHKTLSHELSLGRPQGEPLLPPLLRHPSLKPGLLPTPPPHPQDPRNPPSLQPLDTPRRPARLSSLHETPEVSQASKVEPQLPTPPQLPHHPEGLHSFSFFLHDSPKHPRRFHARRPHVLSSLPDSAPLSPVPPTGSPLRLSGRPTRKLLHRSLSLPRHLQLSNSLPDPPLRPGRPLRRRVQSAPSVPQLAEDFLHLSPRSPPHHFHPGLLGPSPQPPNHPLHPPQKPLSPPPSHPSQPLQLRHVRSKGRGLLPHPQDAPASKPHLPQPAPSRPTRPRVGLQRPLHLYPGRSDSPSVRPRRIRPDPLQQTRAFLGHPKRLGQPSHLRSPQLPPPSKHGVPLFPNPPLQSQALPPTALAPNNRRRRSYPLLPNPPAALPSVVFASRKGKVHFRLPAANLPFSPPSSPPSSSPLSLPASPSPLLPRPPPPTFPGRQSPPRARFSPTPLSFIPRPLFFLSSEEESTSPCSSSSDFHSLPPSPQHPRPPSPPRLLGAGIVHSCLQDSTTSQPPTPRRTLPLPFTPPPLSPSVGTQSSGPSSPDSVPAVRTSSKPTPTAAIHASRSPSPSPILPSSPSCSSPELSPFSTPLKPGHRRLLPSDLPFQHQYSKLPAHLRSKQLTCSEIRIFQRVLPFYIDSLPSPPRP
nr:movement protein [Okra mosaic virus]